MRIIKNGSNGQKDVLLNKWFYIGCSVVFLCIAVVCFVWGRLFVLGGKVLLRPGEYSIDSSAWGTFGDFVGGVLGTFFSIISLLLVIKTFKYQQDVTNTSNDQMVLQRFSEMFFELLRLYQSQVADMCEIVENGNSIEKYTNKDFFDYHKKTIQSMYKCEKSFAANRKKCLNFYMAFYTNNQTKMAAYFRTLYRIYDLIDGSQLKENWKREYLKIMRAQLTNSELFFLRYNALSYYGTKFQVYINKYNILKHLHAFDLLEFKDWWSTLSLYEREGASVLFLYLNRWIRDTMKLDFSERVFPTSNDNIESKYSVFLKNVKGTDVSLTVLIDKSKKNNMAEFQAFDSFAPKQLEQLLDCFIKEVFFYSNFEKFNNLKTAEPYSNPMITSAEGRITIHSGIRSRTTSPLILKDDASLGS